MFTQVAEYVWQTERLSQSQTHRTPRQLGNHVPKQKYVWKSAVLKRMRNGRIPKCSVHVAANKLKLTEPFYSD